MNTGNNLAIVAITRDGKELAKKLGEKLGTTHIYVKDSLAEEGLYSLCGSLKAYTQVLFEMYTQLVFVMAVGIVVRCIAPYLQHKYIDPAVVVVDEEGRHVISLISGHMGGANALTMKISELIGAHPVVTTATDVKEVAALELIAKSCNGFVASLSVVSKQVNGALVAGEKVGLYDDTGYEVDRRGLIMVETQEQADEVTLLVCISTKRYLPICHRNLVQIIPRKIVVGIGCRKGMTSTWIGDCLEAVLEEENIHREALACLASCWAKKDEVGIQEISRQRGIPFEVVSKEAVQSVEHLFEESEFVRKTIGVGCVAEPCAYLLSGQQLIMPKRKYEGVTFALGRRV